MNSSKVISIGLYISVFIILANLFGNYFFSNTTGAKTKSHVRRIEDKSEEVASNLDLFYTFKDVVRCLESSAEKQKSGKLHIAFIGDSLIRHLFTNFIRVFIVVIYSL